MPSHHTSSPASGKTAQKFILDSLHQKEARNIPTSSPSGVQKQEKEPAKQVAKPLAENKAPQEKKQITPDCQALAPLPQGKKYFRIGEAASHIQVEPHVLRYWESEFKEIRPMKSKSGHRVYSRKDVGLFEMIRHLLYLEKFSVKAAKRRIRDRKKNPIQIIRTQSSQGGSIEVKPPIKTAPEKQKDSPTPQKAQVAQQPQMPAAPLPAQNQADLKLLLAEVKSLIQIAREVPHY